MKTLPRLLAFIATLTVATAQVNLDDMTPIDIAYTLTLQDDLSTLQIDIDINNISRSTTRVAMPNWVPGAYRIGRYGERVETLDAASGDSALNVLRLDHQTWSINTAGVDKMRLSYKVKPGRRRIGGQAANAARAKKTGMRVSGPGTFMYVVEAKGRPVTIEYVLPMGWKVANGLRRTDDPMRRRTTDYDTFIDAPTILGVFKQIDFDVNGTPFECVFFENEQNYDFDLQAFVDVCEKIVRYQGELYGSFPFPNYVFLFTVPGRGGLEHLNSTSIGLSRSGMKKNVRAGASVTAHEFFHTWNVKRIRPKTLGPFEYQHENYTGNLWVSEGWTSYYGDLTMVRTGIITPDEMLSKFTRYISRELNKEGRKDHSVFWASRNVWHRQRGERSRVDYYAKGEILGAMIDLKIRQETNNGKSLDDVMVFLNRWFAERGVGFEEGDVERACTSISNYDFRDFFAAHVYGVLDPPLKEYFGYAGIEYTAAHNLTSVLPFSIRESSRGMRVGSAVGTGPQRGDTIVALNGQSEITFATFMKDKKPGDMVEVAYASGGNNKKIDVKVIERDRMTPTLRFIDNPTDQQRAIRRSWLTGK